MRAGPNSRSRFVGTDCCRGNAPTSCRESGNGPGRGVGGGALAGGAGLRLKEVGLGGAVSPSALRPVPCGVLIAQTSLKCPYMNPTHATPPPWGSSESHQWRPHPSHPRPALIFAPPFQAPPLNSALPVCTCPAPLSWPRPPTWLLLPRSWGPCTPRPRFPLVTQQEPPALPQPQIMTIQAWKEEELFIGAQGLLPNMLGGPSSSPQGTAAQGTQPNNNNKKMTLVLTKLAGGQLPGPGNTRLVHGRG